LLIPVICLASLHVRAADAPAATSPPLLLKQADVGGSPAEAKLGAVWREAGIRSVLLLRFGRLLPDNFPAAEQKRVAAFLQDPATDQEGVMAKMVAIFPSANDLSFDGQRYAGANLSYIDSMLGKSGRPIAFDRALPTLLVPITPEAEAALTEQRTGFQSNGGTRKVRETVEQTQGSEASAALFADGQFLRAYAGRFDDLYFHLFQNGNGASAMAFAALTDGLGERTYQPVQGIGRKGANPAAGFDLNDILSDGGKAAVRRYLSAQSDRAAEPFKGFAFRILPTMIARARTLPPGARLAASQAEISRALRARQHFYPTQVPPLYSSPDRFLGWAGSFFIPVANHPALPPGAADSWYPLPQRDSRAPGESAAESASSVQLFESSSAPEVSDTSEMVWEDPQLSNLLADPEAKAGTPAGKSPTPAPDATVPKAETDPRLRPGTTRLIAAVTPTVEEAAEYLAAIAASDARLREIEQARGQLRLLREFIALARAASPDAGGKAAAGLQEVQRAMSADLATFERLENELGGSLQAALQQRADVRSTLVDRLTRDRVKPLQAIGKKAAAAEQSAHRLTL
jgi:hypothetical protein